MEEQILKSILQYMNLKSRDGKPFLLAIDGRCAAGKTTLAAALALKLDCQVFHMDDFYLRPQQRNAERYEEPGGNVDRERFLEEVLQPLTRGEAFSYRPYSCQTQTLLAPVPVLQKPVAVVEGSYSCHPDLWGYYDLHIFLDIDPAAQTARIRERNGEQTLKVFAQKWIPLEEKYFAAYEIRERCELCFREDNGKK